MRAASGWPQEGFRDPHAPHLRPLGCAGAATPATEASHSAINTAANVNTGCCVIFVVTSRCATATAVGKDDGTFRTAVEEGSIVRGLASSRTALKANARRSQALYLFVSLHEFFVELAGLRAFRRVVAAQLVEHLADGKLVYFSQRSLLCAARYIAQLTWLKALSSGPRVPMCASD